MSVGSAASVVIDVCALGSEAALCALGEAAFRSLVFSSGVTQTSAIENSFHKKNYQQRMAPVWDKNYETRATD
jgi:hypothetical protein